MQPYLDAQKLEVLGLFGNKFSGSIPREIGNLTLLKELQLGYKELRGMSLDLYLYGKVELARMFQQNLGKLSV